MCGKKCGLANRTVTIVGTTADAKAFVTKANNSTKTAEKAVKEMVQRHCEQAENQAACDAHLADVNNFLTVKGANAKGATLTVDLQVEVPLNSTGRRLLAVGDAASLVDAAVANPTATPNFAASSTSAAPVAPTTTDTTTNSAVRVMTSVMGVCAVVLVM